MPKKNEKVEEVVDDIEPKDKGRYTTVTYSRTRQVAQFEPEKLEISCTVGKDEDVQDVYDDVKGMVEFLLFGEN